ncbi:MAG: PAS domain-containing sensor histidine kinase [Prolixibacteraceae bacterium]|nr:PAS domain-containing sensor histidine kinase [Prolixibacteraceae bacterium]
MRKGIFASLLVVIMFVFLAKDTSANIYHDNLSSVTSLINKALSAGCTILSDVDETDSSTITHFGNMQYDSAKGELKLGRAMIFFISALILGLILGGAYFIKTSRQKHLDKEQGMLKALIDNIPDTIYFKDLDSKFTRINKAQARLLGLKHPDEAIGKSDFDFFGHAQKAYEVEQEIIRTRKPVVNQIHKVETQGMVRFLSDTKIPLIVNDKCIGTVGITHDITDVKEAEDVMLESQAKFKALFENAPLAFFRLDKDMKVVEFNHRFRKMFGYTDSDIGKITKYDLLVDAEIGSLILDTILETKEVTTEIMLKRKNGESFIANLTLALLEEGFKEIAIEGIVEDITQVAKARDELIKAKDKAIEADRLKSLFLANMSHEIRTPMNAIIGFTNMLREDDLSSEDRNSFIDVIQSNGNSLMSLIESLVDFSKLEADQMSVSKGEFNLNPLLESACDNTEKLLKSEEKEKVKVIRSFENEDGLRIISDRHRLNQVLSHLISNAIKFTEEGEIEIGYKLDGDDLGIFVKDTGIGIQKDKIGKIFDRFTKVSSDKNKLYGGTGIGLTISKGLMELMGGRIEVESKIGKGSTFWLKMKTGIVNEQA